MKKVIINLIFLMIFVTQGVIAEEINAEEDSDSEKKKKKHI